MYQLELLYFGRMSWVGKGGFASKEEATEYIKDNGLVHFCDEIQLYDGEKYLEYGFTTREWYEL